MSSFLRNGSSALLTAGAMSKVREGFAKLLPARAVLTDTLPYELPLYFTNFHLYKWISAQEGNNGLAAKVMSYCGPTVPCKFKIVKAGGGGRSIAVLHPSIQRRVADFYEKYDGFITNLCGKSQLSLRYPTRPASKYVDYRFRSRGSMEDGVDLGDVGLHEQSDLATSYFAYRKFSHVYKFFDSAEFLELENKSRYLVRVDISKCFSSIYTHSLSWAVRGKAFAKSMLHLRNAYFEGEFDKLMRDANWGETNGIVTGPEVSRVFCEVILQCVDVRIQSRISDSLAVRRYIDDYFIFSSDLDSAASAEKIISEELEKFNLYLNDAKRTEERSPLVTSLSVSRMKATELCADVVIQLKQLVDGVSVRSRIKAMASRYIKDVRALARQYGVQYSELAAPALAVLARKMGDLARRTKKRGIEDVSVLEIQKSLASILGLAEFFYLSDVRSSTSNKVAQVFLEVASFCDAAGISRSYLELHMLDTVRRAISIWPSCHLMDIINVVIAVQLIASDRRSLDRETVETILAKGDDDLGQSYFRIMAGLFLGESSSGLRPVKEVAIKDAVSILTKLPPEGLQSAGTAMLALDFLACPYIPLETRVEVYRGIHRKFLDRKGISAKRAKVEVAKISSGLRFTNWRTTLSGTDFLRSILKKVEVRPAYD